MSHLEPLGDASHLCAATWGREPLEPLGDVHFLGHLGTYIFRPLGDEATWGQATWGRMATWGRTFFGYFSTYLT